MGGGGLLCRQNLKGFFKIKNKRKENFTILLKLKKKKAKYQGFSLFKMNTKELSITPFIHKTISH